MYLILLLLGHLLTLTFKHKDQNENESTFEELCQLQRESLEFQLYLLVTV